MVIDSEIPCSAAAVRLMPLFCSRILWGGSPTSSHCCNDEGWKPDLPQMIRSRPSNRKSGSWQHATASGAERQFALAKQEYCGKLTVEFRPMADPITPSAVAPEAGTAPSPAAASDRADLRPQSIQDAVIRLAGNSQDGIQTAGAFLARLAGRSDQDVMTYMTIPATISGGPSIFQVRMGTGEVLSAGDEADFLVAFYQHSYQDHVSFLKEGGVLLYDSDNVEPNLDDKRYVYVGVPITGLTVEALG